MFPSSGRSQVASSNNGVMRLAASTKKGFEKFRCMTELQVDAQARCQVLAVALCPRAKKPGFHVFKVTLRDLLRGVSHLHNRQPRRRGNKILSRQMPLLLYTSGSILLRANSTHASVLEPLNSFRVCRCNAESTK